MNPTLITHLIAAAVAAAAAWFYQGAQMDAAVAKLNATHAAIRWVMMVRFIGRLRTSWFRRPGGWPVPART